MSNSIRNPLAWAALAAIAIGCAESAPADEKTLSVPQFVPPTATITTGNATVAESSGLPVDGAPAPTAVYSGEVDGPVFGPVVAPPRYPWASVIHQPLNYATPVPFDTGYFGYASTYHGKAYPNYTLYPGVRHSPFPYYYPSSRSVPNPDGPTTAARWPGYYYGYGYGFGYGYPYWPGADGTNPYSEGYNPFLR